MSLYRYMIITFAPTILNLVSFHTLDISHTSICQITWPRRANE